MEGLVLLIGALLEGFVLIVLLSIELLGVLIPLLVDLIIGLIGLTGWVIERRAAAAAAPAQPRTPLLQRLRNGWVAARDTALSPRLAFARRWARRLSLAAVVLFAVTLISLLIVNQFFFAEVVRWGASDLPQRHGVTLEFAEADGDLFTGRVHLRQATVKRPQHPSATFDITMDEIEADVDVWRLLRKEVELEHVTARGIHGTYTRVGPKPEQLPKRGYVIQKLRLEDVDLKWADATRPNGPFEMAIEVDELETVPFRSTWAAFDVLFRSNGHGRIAGGPFTLSTREVPDGRETEWHAKDVPVTLAAAYLGGPFKWITEGTIDVDAIDRWQLPDGDPDIEMDWSLTFRNVRAETPADLSAPLRLIAEPVVGYFNAHTEEVPLRLQVTLSKGEFSGRMSPPLELITGIVAEASINALAEKAGAAREQVEEKGRELLDKARELFKRDGPAE